MNLRTVDRNRINAESGSLKLSKNATPTTKTETDDNKDINKQTLIALFENIERT